MLTSGNYILDSSTAKRIDSAASAFHAASARRAKDVLESERTKLTGGKENTVEFSPAFVHGQQIRAIANRVREYFGREVVFFLSSDQTDNISQSTDNVKGLMLHEIGVHALKLGDI